jgi:hypothetical protein
MWSISIVAISVPNHFSKNNLGTLYGGIIYIIGVGLNCETDTFLQRNNMRLFSTPFSYMLIDFETAQCNLTNSFKDYFQVEYIKNAEEGEGGNISRVQQFKYIKVFKYLSHIFYPELFINTKFLPKSIDEDVYKWDRICIFLHHNLNQSSVIDNFKRRIERVQSIFKFHKDKTLLFDIDKQYNLCQIDDKIENINYIMNKYSIMISYATYYQLGIIEGNQNYMQK